MSKLAPKEYKFRTRLGREGDPLGIVQTTESWPYQQVVYALPRIRSRKWDAQNSLEFWDTNESPNIGQMTRPSDSQ